MDKIQFVEAIKIRVGDGTVNSVVSSLQDPPGRKPSDEMLSRSKWFNALGDADKKMVAEIISESVQSAIFSFFCVLDGVSAIEDIGEKGDLILNYEKDGERTWLNSPSGEYLHDLLWD